MTVLSEVEKQRSLPSNGGAAAPMAMFAQNMSRYVNIVGERLPFECKAKWFALASMLKCREIQQIGRHSLLHGEIRTTSRYPFVGIRNRRVFRASPG
jgi:hypothetical protein